jgi:hypothetical protein
MFSASIKISRYFAIPLEPWMHNKLLINLDSKEAKLIDW